MTPADLLKRTPPFLTKDGATVSPRMQIYHPKWPNQAAIVLGYDQRHHARIPCVAKVEIRECYSKQEDAVKEHERMNAPAIAPTIAPPKAIPVQPDPVVDPNTSSANPEQPLQSPPDAPTARKARRRK